MADEITNTYYSNIASSTVFKEENSNLLIQFTQEMNNAASGSVILNQPTKMILQRVSKCNGLCLNSPEKIKCQSK